MLTQCFFYMFSFKCVPSSKVGKISYCPIQMSSKVSKLSITPLVRRSSGCEQYRILRPLPDIRKQQQPSELLPPERNSRDCQLWTWNELRRPVLCSRSLTLSFWGLLWKPCRLSDWARYRRTQCGNIAFNRTSTLSPTLCCSEQSSMLLLSNVPSKICKRLPLDGLPSDLQHTKLFWQW